MKNIILPHEHLAIDLSWQKKSDDTNLNNYEEIILELKELKKNGVSTIVEATNIGMGRNIYEVEKISVATGIKIIYSTGFYQQKFYQDLVKDKSINNLIEIMERDLTIGMDGTNVKASIIGEIGTSWNKITKDEEKVFRAASRLSNKLKIPILTHLSLGTMGIEQIKIFNEEKVDLSKVILSHIELSKDLDYILKVLSYGVNVGIDTCGKLSYLSDKKRIEIIKTIIEKGFIKQLVLSRDISRKSYTKSRGGLGWIYLLKDFKEMMINSGISKEQIKQIMVENPKRIYGL